MQITITSKLKLTRRHDMVDYSACVIKIGTDLQSVTLGDECTVTLQYVRKYSNVAKSYINT